MLETLFNSLGAKYLAPAWAQSGSGFKNFVYISFYGSPPRWLYDLPLGAAGSADIMRNDMVSNRYTGTGRYTDAVYSTFKHNDFDVPFLWGRSVMTTAGVRSARTLLNNMLTIRGIDILLAAHPGAANLHLSAVSGSQSLTAVLGDALQGNPQDPSSHMIKSMLLNPFSTIFFKSEKGHNAFKYDVNPGRNNFETLFAYFKEYDSISGLSAAYKNNFHTLMSEVGASVDALSPAAKSYFKNLNESSSKAMHMIAGEGLEVFQNLNEKWNEIYTEKYKHIITQTLNMTHAGINDQPIGETAIPAAREGRYSFQINAIARNKVGGATDLRDVLSEAHIDRMAAQFAVAEYMIANGLSPSVSIFPAAIQNLKIQNGPTLMTASGYHDQHYLGYMLGVYVNSMYYLAFTACMLEFIATLKAKGIFDDTLIYLGSEFGRAPRTDGSGADHGSAAGCVSLISGRQDEYKQIGRIYKNSAGPGASYAQKYQGSWGHAAPWSVLDNKPLTIVHIWGSVMRLLGVPDNLIPNAVDKGNLLFSSAGHMGVRGPFNSTAVVRN